jgi:hypothetical protein
MLIDHNRCAQSFLDVCIDQSRPLELRDLRNIAALVAQGLHDRTRSQQIFPATDWDQFKQTVANNDQVDAWFVEPSLEEQLASQENAYVFKPEIETSLEAQLAAQDAP